mmetsp:Transcript_32788/g.102185  ORF Transcript_32788/g.102185 Transcript_32788/m.102185 type:complete len:201 (-) Transcript_32788:327-929(-)
MGEPKADLQAPYTSRKPEKKLKEMTQPRLRFFTVSPSVTSSGATCAAENFICPSGRRSCRRPPTGGISKSKDSRQTRGPNRLEDLSPSWMNWLTRRPAMFSPQAFLKGAEVCQCPRPKETATPTLNCSSMSTGTAVSSRKRGTSASACSPVMWVLMWTRTLPSPSSCSLDPGRTVSRPIWNCCSRPTKTLPGFVSTISML